MDSPPEQSPVPPAARPGRRRNQLLLLLCLLLAVVITLFFGTRAFRRFLHPPTDEPIREWMNIPYVAHSYQVPPHVLFRALNLSDTPPADKRPIRTIARMLGLRVEEVIQILEEAIANERAFHWLPNEPPPPPTPPRPTLAPPTRTPATAVPVATPAN